MSIENIKKRILENAIKDNEALAKAQWRKDNEDWLDLSFEIAVKIGSALSRNKSLDKFPRNQKELADAMLCTPQYINKVVKGSENLQLETIVKIQSILGIRLIEIPKETKSKMMIINHKSYIFPYQDAIFDYNGNTFDSKDLIKMISKYNLAVSDNTNNSVSSKKINKYLKIA